MAEYRFVTRWLIHEPQDRVWEALYHCGDRFREWWPNVVAYTNLTPGRDGVGTQVERVVRGRLPYDLRYRVTITHVDPPRETVYDAAGDLVGHGRMILTPHGDATEVVFHWNVRTEGRWLNLLAPLLSWLFAWNHHYVMAQGERGLNAWLAAQRGRPLRPARAVDGVAS